MTKKDRQFVRRVRAFYRTHGRDHLPWRQTTDPYRILVSEIMLQQTQVNRVIPKYQKFVIRFPSVRALARAPLGYVLMEWQGLGYNRRAKYLRECAVVIMNEWHGKFPTTYQELQTLPGIGPYTAGAIMAFAYNTPVPIIETNIRTVYLQHYFQNKQAVSNAELLAVIERTLPKKSVRSWYAALMDYGAHLKKTIGNQNHRSAEYKTQSRFLGSNRQLRGAILRLLTERKGAISIHSLYQQLAEFPKERIRTQLDALTAEGLLQKQHAQLRLEVTT